MRKPSLKEFMKERNSYKRELKKQITSFVAYADSCSESQRKLPDLDEFPTKTTSRIIPKLRRYNIDE